MMELPGDITGKRLGRIGLFFAMVLLLGAFPAFGADFVVRPDQPNTVSFKPQKARFVRFSVVAADGGAQPCIDELEVFEAKGKKGNLAVRPGAKASASSLLEGYPAHKIGHLNDGQYGNGQSWIAAGTANEWAQIELSAPAEVGKVVFSRDRQGQFRDRTPIQFEVLLSMDGKNWTTARSVSGRAAGAPGGAGVPGPPAQPAFYPPADHDAQLRFAVLGEEHAWLKTFGRADINPALVPYNGRVKEYPRHAGDDRLPLPTLAAAPHLDADLSDPSWRDASRGVARVAWPYDFDSGPLVTHAVTTARFGDDLYFLVEADRLLCGHVAALSCAGSAEAALVLRT
ncbi:MAG: discoidin domain-containing protein, partial [Candidatus Hydrogenedens sp.]|nr:discoidin domain-containing protein [Candidatus Hydrogenedens sp.]